MRRLIDRFAGNLSEMARELTRRGDPISGFGLALRLRRMPLGAEGMTLDDLAAAERAKAGVFGPRPRFPDGVDPEAEKDRLLSALAAAKGPDEAAAALGISRRTLYRRMEAHEISASQIASRRRQLSRQDRPAA